MPKYRTLEDITLGEVSYAAGDELELPETSATYALVSSGKIEPIINREPEEGEQIHDRNRV